LFLAIRRGVSLAYLRTDLPLSWAKRFF